MKKVAIYVANRLWVILAIYLTSILIAAELFSVFESKSFADGIWWAVVTALTIGYGDLSPATVPGRITGIFFGHFWIFGIIPMIVANIIVKLLEDKNAFTHEEQEWQEDILTDIAKKVGVKAQETPPDY
ncbi:two pore domain potassium channel family protein [Cellvibrio sp. KY-GH-1]|uniref:potassium channel family protein n=1 Tax=Cellvibrio sp. KY-GH-1 TaxID=2303332 RepID=UPI0012469B15|nr:potassium channel family protein [Cellvibrio sp. KY-GH-1]QEY16290.1 two pore domain potassium channel family protein [Cellvibrio sp. KY-GH-1]